MNKTEYQSFIKEYLPKQEIAKNSIVSFIGGGLMGLTSELLLEGYQLWYNLPRKESGVLVIITLIVISSFLTAIGVFDILAAKLKSALIIPITGFSHSITSAALEYRQEGLILGIGSNIFKLAGSVILYGTVSVYIFGIIRLIIGG